MTTVAYDGRFFVTDGRATAGGIVSGRKTKKLFVIDGILRGEECSFVFAGAGCFERIHQIKTWLENGGDPFSTDPEASFPLVKDDEFGGLLLTQNKELFALESGLTPFPQEYPAFIGSGGLLAGAAMYAGANAIKAVQVACELDIGSGGELLIFDTDSWEFLDPASV